MGVSAETELRRHLKVFSVHFLIAANLANHELDRKTGKFVEVRGVSRTMTTTIFPVRVHSY